MEIFELKPYIEAMLMAADRPVTLQDLAQSLDVSEHELEAALEELETDLMSADRGVQVRHRGRGVRLEMKPQFSDRIGRLLPERKEKPLSSQALEALAIVALKQPVTLGDIDAIRGIESAATMQTLRDRKLIAREARLGPRRQKLWRTTQVFLDTFGLADVNELRQPGRMEEVFAPVFSAEFAPGDIAERPLEELPDPLSIAPNNPDDPNLADQLVAHEKDPTIV